MRTVLAASLGAALLAATITTGCSTDRSGPLPQADLQQGSAIHSGPVLLVTVTGLRADAIGAWGGPPALTPALDRLIANASWAGQAIAASSDGRSSLASILTGLQPWAHGVLGDGLELLDPGVRLLPEVLAEVGYSSRAYRSWPSASDRLALDRGFDQFLPFDDGTEALAAVRALQGRELLWIELRLPTAPYALEPSLVDRLDTRPARLPDAIRVRALSRLYDPRIAWSERELRATRALYSLNVAQMDLWFERLDAALEQRAQDDTLLVIVSTRGEELGDYGQSLGGGSLGRKLIEVPLILDLPAELEEKRGTDLSRGAGQRPATTRLLATLATVVGGRSQPAVAPSLFAVDPRAALSELYLANGENHRSWVLDDLQWIHRHRFAQFDPELYEALRTVAARAPGRRAEVAAHRLRRHLGRFRRAAPFGGASAPAPQDERLELWWSEGAAGFSEVTARWTSRGSSPESADEQLRRAWPSELDLDWSERNGDDVPWALRELYADREPESAR